jgi:hypothetical protein
MDVLLYRNAFCCSLSCSFGLSGLSGFWLNEACQMNQTNQMNQIDLSRIAILRIAALTALKLPLYPVPTSWGKSLYVI